MLTNHKQHNEYKEKKRTIYFMDSSLFLFIKSVWQINFSSFSYKINNKRVSLFNDHFNRKEINIRKYKRLNGFHECR